MLFVAVMQGNHLVAVLAVTLAAGDRGTKSIAEVAEQHARAMGLERIRFLRFSRTGMSGAHLPSNAFCRRMGFRCSRLGVAGSDIVVYELLKMLRTS